MADLFDGVVSESKVYRGAGRVVYAASTVTFPTKITDVMNKTTYALSSGWFDIGGTTVDGVKVGRGVKVFDGVRVDQLKSPILQGEIEEWTGRIEMTLLHTDLATLKEVWEGAASTSSDTGENVVPFGSPSALTERRICVIQRNSKTLKLRMVAVRRTKLNAADYDLLIKSADPSATPFNLVVLPDTAIQNDSNMMAIFEET